MRAIIAGGGTGGHVIPALAVAEELRGRHGAEVVFMGTPRGIETRLVPLAGFELRLVNVGALKRLGALAQMRTLAGLPVAIARAAGEVERFRPDVIIGVGGYASGPAMLAGFFLGVPLVAFEPNLIPGFANRVMAPVLAAAAVQFQETLRWFRRARVTGVPVRAGFFRVPPQPAERRPTLLVFGGSQGARAINRAVMEALPLLHERVPALHLIHQTGGGDYEAAQAACLRAGISAEIHAFIDDMPAAFARAHLLLCRSGASTVAEVMAAGRPAVFVPFPTAADNHQLRNAEALVRRGAAVLLEERDLTPERLVEGVAGFLRDDSRLAAMSAAARQMARPHAAREIALLAMRVAGGVPSTEYRVPG